MIEPILFNFKDESDFNPINKSQISWLESEKIFESFLNKNNDFTETSLNLDNVVSSTDTRQFSQYNSELINLSKTINNKAIQPINSASKIAKNMFETANSKLSMNIFDTINIGKYK